MGVVDADALTQAATQYSAVTPLVTHNTGTIAVGTAISRSNTPVSTTFELPSAGHLEEVLIHLSLHDDSDYHGFFTAGLKGTLKSPSGTESLFLYRTSLFVDNLNLRNTFDWTFTDSAFWGEDAGGTWTLTLYDLNNWPECEDPTKPRKWGAAYSGLIWATS